MCITLTKLALLHHIRLAACHMHVICYSYYCLNLIINDVVRSALGDHQLRD